MKKCNIGDKCGYIGTEKNLMAEKNRKTDVEK